MSENERTLDEIAAQLRRGEMNAAKDSLTWLGDRLGGALGAALKSAQSEGDIENLKRHPSFHDPFLLGNLRLHLKEGGDRA